MWLLARCPPPRVIVDPIGSAVTDLDGVFSTSDPTGGSWPDDATTIRFVPVDSYDLDAYDRLYRTIRERVTVERTWPRVSVHTDECETALPANQCPREGAGLVYRGRKWGTYHSGAMTRPINAFTGLFANLTDAALWPLPKVEDRKIVAGNLGIPLAQLEGQWAALPRKTKSFLWWNQATRSIRPVHSLPA